MDPLQGFIDMVDGWLVLVEAAVKAKSRADADRAALEIWAILDNQQRLWKRWSGGQIKGPVDPRPVLASTKRRIKIVQEALAKAEQGYNRNKWDWTNPLE